MIKLNDDTAIIKYASECIRRFTNAPNTRQWRNTILKNGYLLVASSQWEEKEYNERKADGLPTLTINRTAPVIDAIAGFETQNRAEVTYSPRAKQDEQITQIIELGVNCIEDNCYAGFHDSESFKDMLICGVGGTNTYISYDENPDGDAQMRRVFPGYLGWEPTSRAKNILDSNFVFEAKLLSPERFAEEVGEENGSISNMSIPENDFIEFFGGYRSAAYQRPRIIFEFQWRQKETFYRVRNPFMGQENNQFAMIYMNEAMNDYGIDPQLDSFSMRPAMFNKLKKDIEGFGGQLEYQKHKKFVYYRAIIGGNKVISKSENYTQDAFSILFMTGKFDEANQFYYGVCRSLQDPQQVYNRTISNLMTHQETAALGGYDIEEDAVHDLNAFRDTARKARFLTVFKPGSLAAQKARPKQYGGLPESIPQAFSISDTSFMSVSGVTMDFMGMSDSAPQQAATLYEAKVRQGMTILAPYFDAKRFKMQKQGKLYISLLGILLENNPYFATRFLPKDAQVNIQSLVDGIAAEYDVQVEQSPQTQNERQKIFEKFLDLAAKDPKFIGLALEYAPFNKEQLDQARQLMMPPPPPQPDPMTQRLLAAEASSKEASAAKQLADADKTKAETMEKLKAIQTPEVAETQADRMKLAEMLGNIELKEREMDNKEAQMISDNAFRNREMNAREKELAIKEANSEIEREKTRIEAARMLADAMAPKTAFGTAPVSPEDVGMIQEVLTGKTVKKVTQEDMKPVLEGLAKLLESTQSDSSKRIESLESTIKELRNKPEPKLKERDDAPMFAAITSIAGSVGKLADSQNKIVDKLKEISQPQVIIQKQEVKEKPEKEDDDEIEYEIEKIKDPLTGELKGMKKTRKRK